MHRPPAFAAGILHGPDHAETQSPTPGLCRQIVRIQAGRLVLAAAPFAFPSNPTRRHSSGRFGPSQFTATALRCPAAVVLQQRTPTPGQGLQMRAARQWQFCKHTGRINRATGPGQASTSPNQTRCGSSSFWAAPAQCARTSTPPFSSGSMIH